MEGLPKHGQRIKVWPNPAVKVQASATPISDGGRWMDPEGETVTWDIFRHRQLIAGELFFHDPRPGAQQLPGDAPSLANEVEVAQRRAKFAEDAKAEAAKKLAEAQIAVEQAQIAEKDAAEAHSAALKSSQTLIDKLQDRAPEEAVSTKEGE